MLAKQEHLDFVVLTPHLGARFFLHEIYLREELAALAGLRDEIARQGPGAPLLIAGFEYTDHRQGHLGRCKVAGDGQELPGGPERILPDSGRVSAPLRAFRAHRHQRISVA